VAMQVAAGGPPFSGAFAWAPSAGLVLRLEADGVSSTLLALNGLLFILAIMSSRLHEIERPRAFLVLMLLTQAAVAGLVMARDMVLFYVFWEAVLIPLFILIAAFGEGDRGRARQAAIKMLVFTGLGSLAMLLAILTLFAARDNGTGATFAMAELARVHLSNHQVFLGLGGADLAFLAFALAFAIKTPLFPFHGWLAEAYAAAPTPVVMVLAGVVSKLGPYGFFRVGLGVLPAGAERFRPLLMTLAGLGIVYGALLALRQTDAKRFVAYLSLSHMCFITLGIATGTSTGVAGGLVQMLNHGVLIAALFFIVDHLERKTGTRERSAIHGLARRGPVLASLFLGISLAVLGLPGMNGFVGEYLIMLGASARSWPILLLAASGVVLAAWYTLRFYQGTMNGETANTTSVELSGADVGVLAPVLALALLVGVYPGPLLALIARSLAGLGLRPLG
jgi:NADH-quinone oxidoreductase subunit M